MKGILLVSIINGNAILGLHRSLKAEEGLRYKIYHAELGNKRLQEQSEKV